VTPELARAAIEFLKRTEMRGVECFVMHALLQELDRDAKATQSEDDRPMRVVGGAA
jgi:hypothetical protein